jgi:hypothetical protein
LYLVLQWLLAAIRSPPAPTVDECRDTRYTPTSRTQKRGGRSCFTSVSHRNTALPTWKSSGSRRRSCLLAEFFDGTLCTEITHPSRTPHEPEATKVTFHKRAQTAPSLLGKPLLRQHAGRTSPRSPHPHTAWSVLFPHSNKSNPSLPGTRLVTHGTEMNPIS